VAAKGPSKAQLGWALFDRIVAQRASIDPANPWVLTDKGLVFEPSFDTLKTLLGVPLHLEANTQSGVPALALDVWLAYELRRAGFDADAVWPRDSDPRVMPAPIAALRKSATKQDKAAIENRLRISGVKSKAVASKAIILGKNYGKQVDVVMSDWSTGPEVLISTKRMDSSFGKNAANRVEESYGDAKNLRLRHPQAALGFVFGLRSTIYDKEAAKAEWLLDLLQKLGQEDDAYHAVALILMEYDKEPPPDDESVNEPASGPADASEDELDNEIELEAPVDLGDADAIIASLPKVRLLLDRTPPALQPAGFLGTVVSRVLDTTPVDFHVAARQLRQAPRQS